MKVLVRYDHDPADFDVIELAQSNRDTQEPLEGWVAAYRDTVDGVKYVWVRFPEPSAYVWLRDKEGVRRVRAEG
jgi:hypothetical protein